MNQQVELKATKSLRTASLWQALEEAVMFAQDEWFTGSRLEQFRQKNYMVVDKKEFNQFKENIEQTIRLNLRSQLWENFDEDEYRAYLNAFNDLVFIGNSYFHINHAFYFNPEFISFDGLSLLMRSWIIAHGKELNAMNIQQRNKAIADKLNEVNNYLLGNPFSEKLITALTISLQAGYNKTLVEETQKKYADDHENDLVVWLICKREKFAHNIEIMQRTIDDAQNLLCTQLPNFPVKDVMESFKNLLKTNHGKVELGEFREMCLYVGFMRSPLLLQHPSVAPFDDIYIIPMGALGLINEHVAHSFFLEEIERNGATGYNVNAFDLTELPKDAEAMQHYIDLYISAIPKMYAELTTYNDEYMSEITKLHLEAVSYCHPNHLENYDFDAMIKASLEKRAENASLEESTGN